MATRCLCLWGIHLTTGQTDQSSNTLDHQMSVPREVQVDILLDSQSASQPVTVGQPTSHVQKCQPVWAGHIVGVRRTGCLTTLGPSPESQLSHWFPLGIDLPKAREVIQMISSALYIPFAILTGIVYSFVSTSHNHIFLH